ncbi:hypothetical protein SHI21_10185 [Bacteriovorax sp. PP10]|uniref:Uncharacterized protein n=1 Tax=Bacteriovorax antarcticus TaxID=3088717 RepID=A0ABU5VU38_9BACT|nr:hypothetical protein [Bacteriovorax sp. PP10]MEA9356575.1 hypothetical protein [Bacteriovorax sp. PP10]
MKKLVLIFGALLSAQAFACPDLSGTYQDKNGESVVLAQRGCDEVSVLSRPLTHTLLLDNVFTVVQDDNDVTAYGRGIFEGDVLVLEAKVTYKRDPGIPKFLLPVRAVNKYTSTTTGDLQELGTIYNWYDKVLTTTKTVYKKTAY